MNKGMILGRALAAGALALGAYAVPAVAQVTDAKSFVMKAGASDLYERESSQLVAGSNNAGVKSFAQQMIKDHTDSTAKVKAAAMKSGLKVAPPKLEPEQAQMVAQLRAAKGSARDQLYVSQQKTAHQKALMLHQTYAANGDTPALKTVASGIAPVVQHHIAMLDKM